MKKTYKFNLLLISIIILSCSTSKNNKYPSYVIGKKKFERVFVNKDSLHIVSPSVELYNTSSVNKADYSKREQLQNSILEKLKTELKNSVVHKLELMSKNYLTVNRVLERIIFEKQSNPNLIITAPNEILTPNIKYSVLVRVFGYYGKAEKSILYITLINNKDKLIESVDRYDFNYSPLNNDLIDNQLKKALNQIIKT
jgi:hypothetical protein